MAAIIAGGLAGLALLAVAWFTLLAPKLDEDAAIDLGHGDYVMEGTDGQPFTDPSLRGAPTAVFFGFSHFPEVCPTTLGDIDLWQAELEAAGAGPLRTYFVTVDPERDTLGMIGDDVSWVPGVVGVSGGREEADKAIRAFRVYAARTPWRAAASPWITRPSCCSSTKGATSSSRSATGRCWRMRWPRSGG